MSKELREAAQRLVNHVGESVSAYVYSDDVIDVCGAYLAEHRPDDDELVTVEWMNSLPLRKSHGMGLSLTSSISIWRSKKGWWAYFHAGMGDGFKWIDEEGDEILGAIKFLDLHTRGDVRRLAKGLKIDLGER